MMVILKTRRAHQIRYIGFYLHISKKSRYIVGATKVKILHAAQLYILLKKKLPQLSYSSIFLYTFILYFRYIVELISRHPNTFMRYTLLDFSCKQLTMNKSTTMKTIIFRQSAKIDIKENT